MKDVLEFILKNITTVPDEVGIEEKEEEGGTTYMITVNAADVGRIIGKEGKVIKAIRTIMRVIAIQKGVRVRVSVMSDDKNESVANDMQQSDDVKIVEEVSLPATAPVADAVVQPAQSDEITVEV